MLGSDAVLRALEAEGVEVAFGIPGGAILPIYDAIARGTTVRHILARHEQGAGHMAEGYGDASGRPGVAMVTSGPGATNIVTPPAHAGENAAGGDRQFQGSLRTQVVKVFELAAARSGLRDAEARAAGYQPMTAETEVLYHKAYYPGAHPVQIRVTGDLASGRLLGAQMVGHWSTEVPKRIDTFAAAIHNAMSVDQLSDLDLSYTPPFSAPWDPVQVAAQAWAAATRSDRT